ncbi:MAG: glycerol-3-phosphate dehydrogenase/oxidase [Sandaracinaceae bacterium]|jgi:glycerol-3-phosphate dehydrogenase|nr:glycerol-3-phosphate dehydrogenase/oxidase [Sandaracinaceae bacterium]
MRSSVEPTLDATPTHDVIVIGGGINGTGVARDCALRGFRVALFEKNDLAFGASGNNSGMIHGGPRYLTDHPEVTEQSCRDSGYIQAIAPNLLFRIPFLFPIPSHTARAKVMLAAVDAFFSYYDKFQPLKHGKPHTRLTPSEVKRLEPGLVGDIAGAVTFDEWGTDGHRLCVLNAIDAREHGASIYVHHEVEDVTRAKNMNGSDGRVTGVIARDTLTGKRVTATAKVVVNATGAWSPVTASLAEGASTKLRPGKGIHVVYDRRVSNYAIMSNAIDGRQIFVMPWGNISWIGTTDDDFYGDLDQLKATTDEVRYLVQGIARVLPSIRDARVIGTTAGVRPTLFQYGPLEDKLSREHEIVDHGVRDKVPGLFSMIGGKLASFRVFAEEMTDRVCEEFGELRPCSTHKDPLPGGDAVVAAEGVADQYAVPEPAVRRLVYRHGTRVHAVLSRATKDANERAVVCPCEPVLECEVRHACREEGARTLEDVSRRTRLGLGACGAMRCAHRGAQIVAQETGQPPREAHAMAARFLLDRYQNRAVGIGGAQVLQEELLASRFGIGAGLLAHAKRISASDER